MCTLPPPPFFGSGRGFPSRQQGSASLTEGRLLMFLITLQSLDDQRITAAGIPLPADTPSLRSDVSIAGSSDFVADTPSASTVSLAGSDLTEKPSESNPFHLVSSVHRPLRSLSSRREGGVGLHHTLPLAHLFLCFFF